MGSVITITTDFGTADGYQAVLEGVIAGINPAARVIAITHEVPPGDIAAGWYLVKTHHRYFPPGAIHLAVVDPGVGSRRRIITIQTRRYIFVGPDNGLLSFIPGKDIISIYSIANRQYALSSISPVFHGRDIMAPAAAYLSLGVDPSCLGRRCRKISRLPGVKPVRKGRKVFGRVIYIDRFGNLITNIPPDLVPPKAVVSVGEEIIGPIRRTFSDVKRGEAAAYIGSGGYLEIAVREGSARRIFCPGDARPVKIQVASK